VLMMADTTFKEGRKAGDSIMRKWKTHAKYESYQEASDHRARLAAEGFVPGDTVKVKRCGEGGSKYAVRTTTTQRAEVKVAEVANG